jgi:hypothetical protein
MRHFITVSKVSAVRFALLIMILAAMPTLLSGCTSVSNVKLNATFEELTPKDYDILGDITNTSVNGYTYIGLLDAAKKKYPSAQDVINIAVDEERTVLLCFFGRCLFETVNYTTHGLAIKYK